MNIERFIGSLSKSGVANTSEFQVMVTAPSKVKGSARDISLRVDTVNIPARALDLASFQSGSGSVYPIITGRTFSPVSFAVILSSDMREKEFFESWMDIAVGTVRVDNSEDFRLNYYDSYKGSLVIVKYDVNDKPVRRFECVDAFPTGLTLSQLSWADKDVMKMTVDFAYRYAKEGSV
jgi:hypothetical protein